MMFCRKRVVPPTPPSLLKPAVQGVPGQDGRWSSAPSSDQVPDERNAQRVPSSAGTAATAEAVSCVPGA